MLKMLDIGAVSYCYVNLEKVLGTDDKYLLESGHGDMDTVVLLKQVQRRGEV